MIAAGQRVYAYPYSGYWVDIGIDRHLLASAYGLIVKAVANLNDRSWIIHTRTEERPPVRISAGATIIDSMITMAVSSPLDPIERSILRQVYAPP
jgi:glucose-1-phosphate adenylyltransferase